MILERSCAGGAALALPALAQQVGFEDREDYYEYLWDGFEDRYGDSAQWDAFEDRYEDGFEEQGFFAFADDRFFDEEDLDEQGFFFGDDRNDNDRDWWNDDRNNDDEVVPAVSQSFDQEAESGDVNQSFNVSHGQLQKCANVMVWRTGQRPNQIGVPAVRFRADDFAFEDLGLRQRRPSFR